MKHQCETGIVKEGALGEVKLTTDQRLPADGTVVTSVSVASLDSASPPVCTLLLDPSNVSILCLC